ncbi:Tim44-like domain containing protein [Rhabdaerophilaceae bacterium]
MQNFDVLTLVFLGLAVFVIYKLRAVLGQRTGTEKPPQDLFVRRDGAADGSAPVPGGRTNVVPMPGVRAQVPATPEPEARLAGLVPAESPAFAGLVQIMQADQTFDPQEFIGGARAAYEMIVMAFAQGDRRILKDLLSPEVYEGFDGVITDRERRGEKVETQFVSIDKAEFSEALLRVKSAHVTVKFLSKLITATRDSAGMVVDGSADKVTDVTDIWTFARDVTSRDPNWRLVATESA